MQLDPNFALAVDKEIILRLPKSEEASLLFTLVEKNRAHLRKFLGWVDSSKEVSDTKEFIENGLQDWLALKSLHLSIWLKDVLVGAVGLHEIDYLNRSTSIGYWLDADHQGKGIMTKCVKQLIDFAFNELHLHRVEIRCALHNTRSEKIAQTLGFKLEGTLKEAIFHYGDYFDTKLYALLNKTSSLIS